MLILLGLTLVGLGFCVGIWVGAIRWNDRTSRLVRRLIRPVRGQQEETVTFKGFDQLPAPVSTYFRRTLREGQPIIRSARIVQKGEFCRAEDSWSPFEAEQYISAQPPGFVWDATVRMSSLMRVRVRDAYVAGEGSMEAKILSLVPLVDASAKAELNAGALQRYLAEAVWFPTALLPGEAMKWSAIDSSRALATLSDSGATVSMEFQFNNAGEITGVFTPGRYREVNGKYELTAWRGHFRNYQERNGMRIPLESDVEWQLPEGVFPYWKGRITEVEYRADSLSQRSAAGSDPETQRDSLRRVA
ncbi:MAG TPA: DUF6544 family protein [Blastocatellia bacterium]|jgi:hypothetical protein|nr:DUF6544 family protein [Blastocatellia bacterium]